MPRLAYEDARRRGRLLLSSATFEEIDEVLRRERFRKYIDEADRKLFLETLLDEAVIDEPTEATSACRDPKDDKFLELAVGGGAECIVSGDADLLALGPFRGIPMLTPQGFLDMMA